MRPILYDGSKSVTEIDNDLSLGLGVINCISCTATEERNGAYEMTLDMPMDDPRMSEIHCGSVIKCKASDTSGLQMFRVYEVTKPMSGVVTVNARHISYDLGKIAVKPFEAEGVAPALGGVLRNTLGDCPFTVWTDMSNTTSKFNVSVPKSFRACLGGTEGSILDVFGGEFEWDNLAVKLHAERGNDNGVNIEYGKNLTDLTQEENNEKVYTAIVGYATVNDVTTTGDLIEIVHTNSPKTMIVDFSSDFSDGSEKPTVDKINAKARAYAERNKINIPKINIKIRFVNLWQSEEYKTISALEHVSLCDTVKVKLPKLDIEVSAEVVKTVYNVLLERYESIEIGDARSTLSKTLAQTIDDAGTAVAKSTSVMQRALDHATKLISGGLGGYVYLKPNADGEPEEILVMDSPNIDTAVKVIRMNLGGIAFSNKGYNPDNFVTAWGIDGSFVANFITSGTLDASLATVINLNASNVSTGTLSADRIGANSISVSKLTGKIKNNKWELDLDKGTFTIGDISANNITSGTINAENINVTNINGKNILEGTVHSEQIGAGEVKYDNIGNWAVGTDKVADLAIGTGKISDDAVDTQKMSAYARGQVGQVSTNAYNIETNRQSIEDLKTQINYSIANRWSKGQWDLVN